MQELEGRTGIVTGAARGLGRATALELAKAGATLLVVDRSEALLEETLGQLHGQGARAAGLGVDLTSDQAGPKIVGRALAALGGLDFLVNNAGVDFTLPIEELSLEQWDLVLGVNLRAPFALARAAFPVLRERGGGHIVNIASTAAKRAWPNASAYHASKWGLLGLSHALHAEGRAAKIAVTALVAGGMRTPFLLERFPDLDLNLLQPPEHVARAIRWVLTQPEGTVIPEVMVLPSGETSWP